MKKKIYYIVGAIVLTITLLTILLSKNGYVLKDNKKSTSDKYGTISLMLETAYDSGDYEISSIEKWPTSGYVYNAELSSCENGSILTYNTETNEVSLKSNKTDKCYVYFDVEPPRPTVTVLTTNLPTTTGPLANLTCNGATSTYNQKYNRIEISALNSKSASCNLNYATRTSTTTLTDKVISLSGTTQGTGNVVHETFVEGDYTNATTLTQSEYGTTSQYYSTSNTSTSGTAVTNAFSYGGTEWVSQPSNLTSDRYYHITYTIPSDGYYKFCYELSSGDYRNYLYLYKGTTAILDHASSSSVSTTSDCIDLGNVTSGTQYRVVRRAYTTIATIKFSIQKAGSTKTVDTGYRYEGQNPNNYVWFNNELWRIIGVFDETSHGVAGTNLVKIIRNESIGGLAWHKSDTNNWNVASLKKLLNTEYLNSTDGTNGDNCYGSGTTSKAKCDYTSSGLKNVQNMIQEATWYLGGYSSNTITTDTMYGYERDETRKYSSNLASINANVGLMYASDYGYAVPAANCARTTMLSSYNSASCTLNNWLYGNGYGWTIMPLSYNSITVFLVSSNGTLSYNSASAGYMARPSVYLKSSVYVIDGIGSETDPYIIGMQ